MSNLNYIIEWIKPPTGRFALGTVVVVMGLAGCNQPKSGIQTTVVSAPKGAVQSNVAPGDLGAATAPTSASAYSINGSVTFNWDRIENAATYNLKVGSTMGGSDLVNTNVGSALFYTLNGVADGKTVYASVQGVDSTLKVAEWSASSSGVLVDSKVDSAVTSLTMSLAANGADVRSTASTSFYVNFTGAADNGSGLASYTLITYPQASCAGVPTSTTGIPATATNTAVTGSNGTSYSFKVSATDAAGNIATSSCSDSIKVDTQPPPNLAAFTGTAGQIDSYIDLSLQFSSDVSDYASVKIRRAAGATAPADCSSGTLVATVGSYTNQTISDNTGSPGTVFSYRLCSTDAAGNVNSSQVVENVTSKVRVHTVFVTSSVYGNNLGGLIGADALCQTAASNAGLTGVFKAILSDDSTDANGRIFIKGPVKTTTGVTVAASRAVFWAGPLAVAINVDEFGAAGSSTNDVMTGSSVSGGKRMGVTCDNWTSTNGSYSIALGSKASTTGGIWARDWSCGITAHLYCINQFTAQPLTAFNATSGATTNGDIDLSWTYPASTSGFARLDIRRASGATVPADCSSGTLVTSITSTSTTTYTDATGGPGLRYSYLGCVYDSDGDLVSSHPAANAITKGVYYRIFMTSMSYDGALGGLTGADAKCQSRATAVGLTGNWMALLSSSTINAADRFVLDGPIYNMNNQVVANNEADLFDGTLYYPLYYTESGFNAGSNVDAWTNTSSAGQKSGYSCNNWTSNTSSYTAIIGVSHFTTGGYSFYNWPPYGCDNTKRLYCVSHTYYPPVSSMTGQSGAASGTVDLAIAFPGDTSLYGRVDIRRLSGSVAPNVDCSSDGAVAVTIASGFTDQTVTDSTAGSPGYLFSYRACVYDAQNRLVDSSVSVTNVHSKGTWHRIFATSSTYSGNLGGLSGADATCTSVANSAGLSGSFAALLSTSSVDARNHVTIGGPIYNSVGALIATSATDFFDNALAATIYYDEFGVYAGGAYVWTGSYLNGTQKTYTCSDWMSTATNGDTGYPGSTTGSAIESGWGAVACSGALKIYCISQ